MAATPSMSRTGGGCCYDNAPMESFFHTLKVELVHQCRWATRDEARRDLFAYIEGYYNRRRIHSAHRLQNARTSREAGGVTPVSIKTGNHHGQAVTREQHDPRSQDVLHRSPAVLNDPVKLRATLS